ncbi:WD40-repeat-containing domain protein [Mycena rebaudengoi]|nr:WD40-repeat-containing domain protein [Mycena rebaudengoi]
MASSNIPIFQLAASIKAHTDNINAIAFAEDGKHFASGGDDGLIRISDATTGRGTHQFRVVSPIRSILWHPGRTTVLTTGLRNGLVLTIQVQRNNKCLQFEHSVDGTVHCMAFSHTGKSLAIGFKNQVLIVRQTSISSWSDERYLPTIPDFKGETDITRSIQFHTKDKLVLVTYLFAGVMAYETEDFGVLRWHITAEGLCGESALSASSRLLVVTDPTDGVHVLRHNDEMVQALAYCYIKDKGTHLLVTGTSEQFDECSLNVWTAVDKQKKNTSSFSFLIPHRRSFLYSAAVLIGAILVQLSQTFPLPWGSKADIHEVTNTATVDYIHTVTKTVETVGKVTKVKALN